MPGTPMPTISDVLAEMALPVELKAERRAELDRREASAWWAAQRQAGSARLTYIVGFLAVIVVVLGITHPAWGWHVEGIEATCSAEGYHVTANLTDAGPGTFVDSQGVAGTFGDVTSFEFDTDAAPGAYQLHVTWTKGTEATQDDETAVLRTQLPLCEQPTTTTTLAPCVPGQETVSIPENEGGEGCVAPTTTTTVAPTTTTELKVYTSPPPSVPAPPVIGQPVVAIPELPNTGANGDLAGLAIIGTIVLILGLWLVSRNGRAPR